MNFSVRWWLSNKASSLLPLTNFLLGPIRGRGPQRASHCTETEMLREFPHPELRFSLGLFPYAHQCAAGQVKGSNWTPRKQQGPD